jgi:hypothetical protein
LTLALDFIERSAGNHNDRLCRILAPHEVAGAVEGSGARGACPKAARRDHAAYNIHEFFNIIREHGKTSIELLKEVGLMSNTLNIGHGNFVPENPLMTYFGGRDLEKSWERMAASCRTARSTSRGGRAFPIPGALPQGRRQYRARHQHLPARCDHADADGLLFRKGYEPKPARASPHGALDVTAVRCTR